MKAHQRKRLVTKWFVLASASVLLWISVSAGMFGRLLVENLWAQNLIEAQVAVLNKTEMLMNAANAAVGNT